MGNLSFVQIYSFFDKTHQHSDEIFKKYDMNALIKAILKFCKKVSHVHILMHRQLQKQTNSGNGLYIYLMQ